MKAYLKDYEKKEYFSQNREDLILEAFFYYVKDGFYIDVGAFDPDYDSVTKRFYRAGWRGINIEPQLEKYQLFCKRRPRDINVGCGVGDIKSELRLRVYESGGLSTLSPAMQTAYETSQDASVKKHKDISVPVRPLREILDEAKTPRDIHFMKVDVEGFEYQVIVSNDWKKYKPHVICIESNHIQKDWRPLLVAEGYELVFFDGLNDYYCQQKSPFRHRFDYVEHVVNRRGGGIRHEDLDKIKEMDGIIEEFADQYKKDVAKVKKLEDELRQLRGIVNSRKESVKHAVKTVLRPHRKER